MNSKSSELSSHPNKTPNPDTPFKWILLDEDIPHFIASEFEKQPKLFQSGNFERFEFDRRAFFEILITHLWNVEALRFVENGALSGNPALTSVHLNENGQFTLDKLRVTRAAKTTIILNNLERFHRGIGELVHGFTSSGYFTGKANTYFTPANAQGFRAHWDTHDVFILQISGEKQWRIDSTAAIVAPMEDGTQYSFQDYNLADPVEYNLKAGNVLYIPAGFGHFAKSLDSDSLHVTVGFRTITWLDLLQSSLDSLAKSDPMLRKSAGGNEYLQELGVTALSNHAEDIIKQTMNAIDLPKTFLDQIKSRRKSTSLSKGELAGNGFDDLLS